MKLFLTNFMRKNQSLQRWPAQQLSAAFDSAVEVASTALGRQMFRPQRALNASVADAILVGLARRLKKGPITDGKALKAAVEATIKTPAFAELYQVGTTNADKVTGRIDAIESAIKDIR
jgi:hypothetical protein